MTGDTAADHTGDDDPQTQVTDPDASSGSQPHLDAFFNVPLADGTPDATLESRCGSTTPPCSRRSGTRSSSARARGPTML